MTTISKIIASVAVLSALATAPASARSDADEGHLSAYASNGNVQSANILVNRQAQ